MTGNTSGPHIHMNVTKDKNADGSFEDNKNDGVVDPFGWQSSVLNDPWQYFEWTDIFGTQRGAKSEYLWAHVINTAHVVANNVTQDQTFTVGNKTVTIEPNTFSDFVNIIVSDFTNPGETQLNKSLEYIPETSFVVSLIDIAGTTIDLIDKGLKFEIDFDLTKTNIIDNSTIALYHYKDGEWIIVDGVLFDLSNNIATAYLDSFSQFALFGEKEEPTENFKKTVIVKNNTFEVQNTF